MMLEKRLLHVILTVLCMFAFTNAYADDIESTNGFAFDNTGVLDVEAARYDNTGPFLIDDLLNEVVSTHPQILEAFQVLEGLKYELEAAKSGKRPNMGVEMSAGREYTNGVDTDDESRNLNAGTAGVYARQNIYDGKRTDSYVEEVRARKMAAAYEVLNVANEVFIAATEAYLGVLKERELLKLYMDNVYTQAQILAQIKEKTDAGFGRRSDLINSQSRLSLARANVVSQQQNLKQALVRLHKHLGRYVHPDKFEMPNRMYEFPEDIGTLVNFSLEKYPAIQVAKYNILVKKYTLKRTEALYMPKVDAELRADYMNNTGGDEGDTKSASAMVYFRYDIYDGGSRGNMKKKNYADILKENERAYIERRNLNESVRLAYNIMMSEESKKQFLEEHLDLTGKTLDAFKEEYQLGRRTLVELLDMENEFQSAKEARIESRFSALVAKYRVLYVTGILIYEYKTDLIKKTGVTDSTFTIDMLKKSPELEDNRDSDIVKDEYDQCDNSLFYDDNNITGCVDYTDVQLGYKTPDVIEPYIKPMQSSLELDTLGDAESLGEPDSLGEPEQSAPAAEEKSDEVMLIKDAPVQTFNFSNILFQLNSAKLTKSSYGVVNQIAEELKKVDNYRLEIIGHTDTSGRAAFNKKLSGERAKSVYNRLVALGVPAENIATYGKGETEPLHSNATREGRKLNRRIEFKLRLLNANE
ncbi:MAG: TolC family protein [Deferribacterales bacterium]